MSQAQRRHATDPAAELELHAYNSAFYELGLRWHWDAATYDALRDIPCRTERLRTYLERHQSHLLKVYDAEFLSDAIEVRRNRYREDRGTDDLDRCRRYSWAGARTEEVGH
ncbi:MAG: hypothetical protein JSR59_00380 [Proteobacteria bacterium]|nr:hypothetical protein [Pseudomonadota bacterium]